MSDINLSFCVKHAIFFKPRGKCPKCIKKEKPYKRDESEISPMDRPTILKYKKMGLLTDSAIKRYRLLGWLK